MGINAQSKALIEVHYKRKYGLNFDGVINEKSYNESKVKILYVLKESWGNDKDYSIIEGLNETICANHGVFGTETRSQTMFYRLAEWSYAIENNIFNYDTVCEKLNEKESKQSPLCKVGYINVSKEISEDEKSNWKKLKAIFDKNKSLLKEQIELIEPDLIICCGVSGKYGIADWIAKLFNDNAIQWEDGGFNGVTIIDVNNKKTGVISSSHPAYPKSKKDLFSDIKSGWEKFKDL